MEWTIFVIFSDAKLFDMVRDILLRASSRLEIGDTLFTTLAVIRFQIPQIK